MMKILTFFLLTIFLLTAGCTKKSPNSRIVAEVGSEKINFRDFLESFLLSPHFRSHTTLKEAREAQVKYMADRIFLRKAAEKVHLEEKPEIQSRIGFIRRQEILKYMYRKEILDNIQVSDSEAWKEFKRENIKVHLRHLYAPTREQAEKYYHELKNGATFAQLAREAFKDTVLSKNGGDLGYVGIDDLDPMLADSVYQQRIGVFSHPLRSGFGYHIVRVEDIQQNIFLTREDFEMRKESLKNAVRRRRAQVFSRRYLARVLKGKSLHIKSAVLNRLVGDIGKTLPAPKAESPLAHPSVSDADIDRLDDSLEKFSRATLVEFNGESWSVAEYLRRLKKIPPLQRPVIQNRQQLIKNIIDMARDELLLEIAYRKGYQRSGEVKKAVRRWRNELLADEFWKRIHWVQYQKLDPQEWRRRKEIYEKFKRTVPVSINEKNLFQDVPEKKLLEKQVPLPTVIRNAYVW